MTNKANKSIFPLIKIFTFLKKTKQENKVSFWKVQHPFAQDLNSRGKSLERFYTRVWAIYSSLKLV